jgi:hypothetical protein
MGGEKKASGTSNIKMRHVVLVKQGAAIAERNVIGFKVLLRPAFLHSFLLRWREKLTRFFAGMAFSCCIRGFSRRRRR